MATLDRYLTYFIQRKIDEDAQWRSVDGESQEDLRALLSDSRLK